jgi:S-formylglutathione hydrolase FrmB
MRQIGWVLGIVMLACVTSAADKSGWNKPSRSRVEGVQHGTFRSASMRTEVGYNICLPPEHARETQRRFPVIYYLHGYEGNESSYLDYAKFWRESLSRTGPTILVFANGGPTSFFSDAPDNSVMGETVVKELVAHIDSQFRTQTNARGRSMHGYSMGGFGALKLVLKYPDLFGSAVAYGATLSDAKQMQKHLGKVYRQMFGTVERFEANNPLTLARNAEKLGDRVALMTVIGTRDEFFEANRQLREHLQARKIPIAHFELPGVKHAKDPLYERAAASAFKFSAEAFSTRSADEKKKAR